MLDFKDKKVLVTGHTGFKGSWLTLWLLQLGAKVSGLSLPGSVSEKSHFDSLELSKDVNDYRGDVRDYNFVKSVFDKEQPEIVFHLAAQALVVSSFNDPMTTFNTNVVGTMNIMEALRHSNVKVAVIITSDKCYRNDEQVWGYKETDYLGGHDPYSASKSCAEIVAHSYIDTFLQDRDIACVTVRAGNVIGGGDWAENRIVPDCEKAWVKRESALIRSPYATRPWQLVLEPLSGYLHLADLLYKNPMQGPNGHKLKDEAYNFGPSASVCNTVEEVVLYLQKYWDNFEYKIDSNKPKVKECNLLKLCCDKALAYLNWEATLTFEETMEFTATWYRDFENNTMGNAKFISMGQLAEYTKLAASRGRSWVI